MFYPGRWHTVGFRVIYAPQSWSLAALEYLVPLNQISLLANNFVITTLFIPDDIKVENVYEASLTPGWTDFRNYRVTQSIGTTFLKESKSLLFKVPSAIIQKEYNYLINPNVTSMQHCYVATLFSINV